MKKNTKIAKRAGDGASRDGQQGVDMRRAHARELRQIERRLARIEREERRAEEALAREIARIDRAELRAKTALEREMRMLEREANKGRKQTRQAAAKFARGLDREAAALSRRAAILEGRLS